MSEKQVVVKAKGKIREILMGRIFDWLPPLCFGIITIVVCIIWFGDDPKFSPVVVSTDVNVTLHSCINNDMFTYAISGMPALRFEKAMKNAGYEVVTGGGRSEYVIIKGQHEPFSSLTVSDGEVRFSGEYGNLAEKYVLKKIAEGIVWGDGN
jgi:hypothetical protein